MKAYVGTLLQVSWEKIGREGTREREEREGKGTRADLRSSSFCGFGTGPETLQGSETSSSVDQGV